MHNDIKKMMEQAAEQVAARIDAHPSEVLVCMQAEWNKGSNAKRKQITAYLKKETATRPSSGPIGR